MRTIRESRKEDEMSKADNKKPFSPSHENGTDTNQASEDELDNILDNIFWLGYKFAIDKLDKTPNEYLAETIEAIAAIIRTEKLKLLAEVRERVLGEGDLVDAEILKKLYDKAYSNGYNDKGYENSYNSQDYRSAEDIAPIIAKIRGEYDKRLANITKLEADL